VSYQYDAYGTIVNQSGSLYDERQFAGEQADPTGLTYLRARFYDATTGRFLSRDPKDGWSYGYAGDNPASNLDPSGMTTVSLGGTTVDLGDISQSLQLSLFYGALGRLANDPTDATALIQLASLGIQVPSAAAAGGWGTDTPQHWKGTRVPIYYNPYDALTGAIPDISTDPAFVNWAPGVQTAYLKFLQQEKKGVAFGAAPVCFLVLQECGAIFFAWILGRDPDKFRIDEKWVLPGGITIAFAINSYGTDQGGPYWFEREGKPVQFPFNF